MPLPNVTIDLQNGNLGRVAQTNDGVAGMILTGSPEGEFGLNTVYRLFSFRELTAKGVTEAVNPLVYKDVSAFYAKKGEGAELWLIVVSAATTLFEMFDGPEGGAFMKLLEAAGSRIRLFGLNRLPPAGYVPETEFGIDQDSLDAIATMAYIGEGLAQAMMPFRVFIPGLYLDEENTDLFEPRATDMGANRAGVVLAADKIIGGFASAAIGQALGVAASIPVHQSIARVKNGAVASEGWLTNGKTPESMFGYLDALHDAGYIIYRTYAGRTGYYFNDDPMVAPVTDDYSNLSLGRTIDKAILLVYDVYVDELNDNVQIDEDGKIPVPMCRYYEGLINNAVAARMDGEISNFEAFVDPEQNVLRDETLLVSCGITPLGTLKKINVQLGFKNPALNR